VVEAIPQIGVQRRRGAAAVEVSFMQDVKRWGVLTTGLGNARFSNRNGKGER
jgi:hypothetical protein